MSKKNILLILTLVILGSLYLIYFTDLFRKPVIYISARPRMERPSRNQPEKPGVSFSFDSKCELTQVRLVSLAEFETNKYARAYWHLISDSNSTPVKGLIYGETIKGMKPKIPKMNAQALEPGHKYRLFIEAGKRTGQIDFEIPARRASR